jgi:ABC-type multidrug transport system ATPase subunit
MTTGGRGETRRRKPIPYTWRAMLADWYHGIRDGWAGIPHRDMAEPVTTPHRETLVRLAEEIFEQERLRYEADRAAAVGRGKAASARLTALRQSLPAATDRLVAVSRPLSVPEQRRRRIGDLRHGDEVVVERRRAEHRRGVDSAWASVARIQAEIETAEAEYAAATADEQQALRVATSRVLRVHQHIQLRMAAYVRQLVRVHENGAWAGERLIVPVDLPLWTRLELPETPQGGDAEPAAAPGPSPPAAEEPAPDDPQAETILLLDPETVFGSAVAEPYRIEAPGTAPHHFALTRRADGLLLRDFGYGNGPYMFGEVVKEALLGPGDQFEFADRRYRVLDDCAALRATRLGDIKLILSGVRAKTAKNREAAQVLLSDMSFVQRENTVVAILGPSGAGKTSLFRALMGEIPVEEGEIYFDHLDVRTQPAQVRQMLGFVPQHPDMHASLTVRTLLRYAFDLRDPRGSGARERTIDEICTELDIVPEWQERLVSALSGGQRQRVSIALELLSRPPLLMLDEPTSGLDAGLDRKVMWYLRRYAEGGRTVIVITHSTEHLHLAHHILVVADRGRPLYSGPPGELLRTLGVDSYADLMDSLSADPARDPDRFVATRVERYNKGLEASKARAEAAGERAFDRGRLPAKIRKLRSIRVFWRQFKVLTRRQIRLLGMRGAAGGDRAEMNPLQRLRAALAPWLPLVTAALSAFLAAQVTPDGGLGARAGEGGGVALSLLSTLAVLSGQALSYSNLVTELPIIRREYRTGTRVGGVMMSKFLVFSVVAVLQAVTMTLVFCLFRPAPVNSLVLPPMVELAVDLTVLTVASMSLGLLISAYAKKLEHAVVMVTVSSLTQIALNGSTADLTHHPWLDYLAMLFPDRWGLAAAASSVDLSGIAPTGRPPDGLWRHSTGRWAMDLAWLVLLTIGYFSLATYRLATSLRPAEAATQNPRPRRPSRR